MPLNRTLTVLFITPRKHHTNLNLKLSRFYIVSIISYKPGDHSAMQNTNGVLGLVAIKMDTELGANSV